MATEVTSKERYLAAFKGFEARMNGESNAPFHQLRRQAIEVFDGLGFPTRRDEAWTHTNVAPIVDTNFSPALPGKATVSSEAAAPYTFADQGFVGSRLTFVNGALEQSLSETPALPDGVTVTSIRSALSTKDERLLSHLGRLAPVQDQAFAALNTAFLDDGAFVYVPRNVEVADPILLLFLSNDSGQGPFVSYPRVLVVAESGAKVTVVEAYAGLSGEAYFTNAVSELVADDNAIVDHYRLELESPTAYHVGLTQSRQGRSSNVSSHAITLGGLLVRNEMNALLAGEGGEATINGFYLMDDEQHVDNHTLIEHAQPNCSSHELFKGLMGGRSTGVFRGKIHVHQIAQKTDAYQANRNLLLSDDADINTKPQLEIYADDVKCSHGATIGQLDENAIYYLRARGVGLELAHQMLVKAFAEDLLDRIKVEPVRTSLAKWTMEKFDRARNSGRNP